MKDRQLKIVYVCCSLFFECLFSFFQNKTETEIYGTVPMDYVSLETTQSPDWEILILLNWFKFTLNWILCECSSLCILSFDEAYVHNTHWNHLEMSCRETESNMLRFKVALNIEIEATHKQVVHVKIYMLMQLTKCCDLFRYAQYVIHVTFVCSSRFSKWCVFDEICSVLYATLTCE